MGCIISHPVDETKQNAVPNTTNDANGLNEEKKEKKIVKCEEKNVQTAEPSPDNPIIRPPETNVDNPTGVVTRKRRRSLKEKPRGELEATTDPSLLAPPTRIDSTVYYKKATEDLQRQNANSQTLTVPTPDFMVQSAS